jgi:hypothetical protein
VNPEALSSLVGPVGMIVIMVFVLTWALLWFFVPFMLYSQGSTLKRIERLLQAQNKQSA